MNINNNISGPNVSNLIASSISKLNLSSQKVQNESLSSKQALDKNIDNDISKEEEIVIPNENAKKVDVDDIQKYAQMLGENISIDDINYGLMYGRSVIADYIA